MLGVGSNDRFRKPFDGAEQVSRLRGQVDRVSRDLDSRASHHVPVRLRLPLGLHQMAAIEAEPNRRGPIVVITEPGARHLRGRSVLSSLSGLPEDH
jgi:hypothetical protein